MLQQVEQLVEAFGCDKCSPFFPWARGKAKNGASDHAECSFRTNKKLF